MKEFRTYPEARTFGELKAKGPVSVLVDGRQTTVLRSGCGGEYVTVPAGSVGWEAFQPGAIAMGQLAVRISTTVFNHA